MIAASLLLAAAQTATFTADRIAADNITRAVVASGHVHAVSGVMSIRSDYMERDADGLMRFHYPTCATTCTNDVGHTHWNVTGDVAFRENDYVVLRNVWLRFYEIPILWLPYMYYPLDTKCGFSWMPGYSGRWGAYLLTKYRYHIAGDTEYRADTWWLHGDTRLDLRTKNGVALGEDLWWNLGDFGHGTFSAYYAWDEHADKNYGGAWGWGGSSVDRDRHLLTLKHSWEPTERDIVRVQGSHYSDSYVTSDFDRKTFFNSKSRWLSYPHSGVFWEHLEDAVMLGAEASGRLNKFYGMTGRLPEIYLDVNPTPVFGLPVNYESGSKFGYLRRDYARYGLGESSVLGVNPGLWATYDSCRFDTYHRLTLPFRTFDDTVSVVPRVGVRGTWWSESGLCNFSGIGRAHDCGDIGRFAGEGGVTFAGRGVCWINDEWRHLAEPYLDILAQKVWYEGLDSMARAYVFDNADDSLIWEDQFAGRSRNLPYSYAGITPGFRQVWSRMDDKGRLRRYAELDLYAAAQFNTPDFYGENEYHRLAEPASPHYGERKCEYVPGARLAWTPLEGIALGARAEYDSDANKIAFASVGWSHRVSGKFKYNVSYVMRDHRYWDFSSFPHSDRYRISDEQNFASMRIVTVSLEHEIFDWLVWSPHLRWDARDGDLDTVGFWVDYRTDCLGFRLLCEYENEFRTIDGHLWGDDFSVGFYIYLRAFGSDGIFSSK